MGIGSAMKELVQDIASSRKDRVERVSEIKEEAKQVRGAAQDLIRTFQSSRKQGGVQLRKGLARDKASRKSGVTGMLKDLRNSRREEGARRRQELAHAAAELRSEVKGMLEVFCSDRKETGSELRKELAESRSTSKSEVSELLKKAQDLIRDFKGSRKKMGSELRRELAQSTADRKSEVKKMRHEFGRAQAEVRGDLKEARVAWQGLATTKGARVKVPKVKPPVAEEEKVEVPIAEEGIPDLEAKLLAAISEHPQGITLAEVAESLGVAPIVLGRASRSLLEKGKIRKEEKLYFPVASE